MALILIIVVLLLLFGGGGRYGDRSGYYGAGGFGGLLVLLAVLCLVFGGGLGGVRGLWPGPVASAGTANRRPRAAAPVLHF